MSTNIEFYELYWLQKLQKIADKYYETHKEVIDKSRKELQKRQSEKLKDFTL